MSTSYHPPEINFGKSQISLKSDIFSLALLLFLFIFMNYLEFYMNWWHRKEYGEEKDLLIYNKKLDYYIVNKIEINK